MTYRNLTGDERKLVERVVNYRPLRRPVDVVLTVGNRVSEIFPDGTLRFECNHGNSSDKQTLYPVEAHFVDEDGVPVNALVFYINDEVSMLEIVKADSSEIFRKPPPEAWEIFDLS